MGTSSLQVGASDGEESLDISVIEETQNQPPDNWEDGLGQVDHEFDRELFIEEVRSLPCLWNTSLVGYTDRAIKINAWKKLSSIFNRDGK